MLLCLRFIPVFVINEPLPDEVLVIFDMLIELLELPNLEAHEHTDYVDEEKERVESPGYDNLRLQIGHEERNDAVGDDVRNSKGKSEATYHGSCDVHYDESEKLHCSMNVMPHPHT